MKKIEKPNWQELNKQGWQMNGSMMVSNDVGRMITYEYDTTVFAVYAFILSHRNTKTNKCFPSVKTIADELGVSKSTVEKSITKLVESDYLIVNSGKQNINNNYYFPLEPFFKDFDDDLNQKLAYRRKSGFKKKKKEKEDNFNYCPNTNFSSGVNIKEDDLDL